MAQRLTKKQREARDTILEHVAWIHVNTEGEPYSINSGSLVNDMDQDDEEFYEVVETYLGR